MIYETILASDLRYSPKLDVKDEKLDSKEKQQDFYIQELQQDLCSMRGHLFGVNGNNGKIGHIIEMQRQTLEEMRQFTQAINSIDNRVQRIEDTGKFEAEHQENDAKKISIWTGVAMFLLVGLSTILQVMGVF